MGCGERGAGVARRCRSRAMSSSRSMCSSSATSTSLWSSWSHPHTRPGGGSPARTDGLARASRGRWPATPGHPLCGVLRRASCLSGSSQGARLPRRVALCRRVAQASTSGALCRSARIVEKRNCGSRWSNASGASWSQPVVRRDAPLLAQPRPLVSSAGARRPFKGSARRFCGAGSRSGRRIQADSEPSEA